MKKFMRGSEDAGCGIDYAPTIYWLDIDEGYAGDLAILFQIIGPVVEPPISLAKIHDYYRDLVMKGPRSPDPKSA